VLNNKRPTWKGLKQKRVDKFNKAKNLYKASAHIGSNGKIQKNRKEGSFLQDNKIILLGSH